MDEAFWNGFLNELIKTEWFRILAKKRHAALVALIFFGSFDIRCTLDEDEPYSIMWWSLHACLLGFFYCFLQPFVRFFSKPRLIEKPSYIYYEWYASWLSAAIAYHLPISRSVGVSIRMNPSLLLTTFACSVVFLLVFHSIIDPSHYSWKLKWTSLKLSVAVSVACCVFMRHCSHCRERPLAKGNVKLASWLTADEIFHFCCLWAGVIGIYIVKYYTAKRSGEENTKDTEKPDFLDMVPWYSGTSADLYKTAFNLLVSVVVFLGRFDMRILQATTNQFQNGAQEEDFLFEEYSEDEELWFDFIADTGDGGNSTYTVARLLARPSLRNLTCPNDGKLVDLQRGNFLLIGGDIAYPNPSQITYEKRLFLPFKYALDQPPEDHAVASKPEDGMSELKHEKKGNKTKYQKQVPRCFIIPGNHDWFDGLHTFMNKICDNKWLGGWLLPQEKSYFALKLSKGWWVFGLDLALLGDLDVYQFKFFSKVAEEKVGKEDSVIVMTHQPDWLLNWYANCDSKNNVSDLISNILKERCKLRIAGDIHHYMRQSIPKSGVVDSSHPDKKPAIIKSDGLVSSQPDKKPAIVKSDGLVSSDKKPAIVKSDELVSSQPDEKPAIVKSDVLVSSQPDKKPSCVQHLLVNGCGGAYVHPTHVFRDFSKSREVPYECKEYPSFKTSRKLALRNIWNFRKENLQFDFVGGIIYFILVFSMFPQCDLDHIFQVADIPGFWKIFCGTWNAFIYMLEHSYVSLGGAMLLLTMAIAFVPSKVSWRTRVMIGILHVSAHLAAALILMLLLEVGVEMLVRHKFLATAGYHSLYRRYQTVESTYFLVSNGTQARVGQWTFGIYPACIKYLLSAFDVPELMAVTRSNICENGMESISRGTAIIYYASVFLYFWILSTPFVSFVFGSYLYICINWFNLHYDEGFSSLRIADYKAFTRFHINSDGDLEVFTLAVDKVPKDWILDKDFEEEQAEENKLSYEREFPSKWRAAAENEDPTDTVRIIDQFVIYRTKEDDQKH